MEEQMENLTTTNGAEPAVKLPGYVVVHEDGHIDAMRVTADQLVNYAEILLQIASQFLAAHREHKTKEVA
jgi:hypothetical protein